MRHVDIRNWWLCIFFRFRYEPRFRLKPSHKYPSQYLHHSDLLPPPDPMGIVLQYLQTEVVHHQVMSIKTLGSLGTLSD